MVRERSCAFCLNGGRLLAIELRDPASRRQFWSLPGGEIEPGESARQAAARETLEETGYTVVPAGAAWVNEYQFSWNGAEFQCRTHWFRATLADTPPQAVHDADYIIQATWLPWPDARDLFNYHPAIEAAVDTFLTK